MLHLIRQINAEVGEGDTDQYQDLKNIRHEYLRWNSSTVMTNTENPLKSVAPMANASNIKK